MKICLIRPPKLMIKNASSVVSFPPLGMAIIAAVLKSEGHEVQVIDAAITDNNQQVPFDPNNINTKLPPNTSLVTTGLSSGEVVDLIDADTDIIGFSCMFSIDWVSDRALINFIDSKMPGKLLIAAGESASGMPDIFLKQCPGLTACVIGEGEETILEFIAALKQNKSLQTVNGLMFRGTDGFIKTPKRERLRKLDMLPIPAWEEFPVTKYPRPIKNSDGTNGITLPLIATRGCPYRCTFCTSPDMWGTRYFMRSPESVVGEMEYLKSTFGVVNFDFFDLTAIIQKKWVVEFSNLLKERKLNITWRFPAGTRSEAIDEEVIEALSSSGCKEIIYAPESGSERVLELIKKKVIIPKLMESMQLAKKHDMRVYINMIIGLPGEKHIDIFKTCLFLMRCAKLGVNDVGLAKFRPYPGSALFDDLHKKGIFDLNSDEYFIDSLFVVDSIVLNKFYNTEIRSSKLYMVYYFLYLSSFYSFQFIFQFKNFKRIMDYGTMYRYGLNLKKDIIGLFQGMFTFNDKSTAGV
jgi:anaerobic magnesium-protoporphyrin IX monomethyl ester cyclase